MRRLIVFVCLAIAACSAAPTEDATPEPVAQTAQPLLSCVRRNPRLTPADCTRLNFVFNPNSGSTCADSQKEFVKGFIPGSHQSPRYASCPASSGWSTCTNDAFRNPSTWDQISGVSDYQGIVYNGHSSVATGAAYVETLHGPLSTSLGAAAWSRVTSIDWIEVEIAWSTSDFQQISLQFLSSTVSETRAGQLNGNNPGGTLNWIRMTNVPGFGPNWSLADANGYRDWVIENDNPIDATHRGIFIQSVTETIGFQYNGGLCP